MLEIQPYRLIGQSLRQAVRYIIEKKSFFFHHNYSLNKPMTITVTLRPSSSKGKRLVKEREIALIDYVLLEVFHQYLCKYLSSMSSSITDSELNLVESVWQHILTRFVFNECSPLLLLTSPTMTNNPLFVSTIDDPQFWSDEHACLTLQRLIDISTQCAAHGNDEPMEFTVANEYLISILQKMATMNCLFSNE